MATALSYPGVYIEEVPSGVRSITGVATSITGFIGSALRGQVDEPVLVNSFAEFERTFGGLTNTSALTYAVNDFFRNGGRDALIVRAAHLDGAGTLASAATATHDSLDLVASNPGEWGNNLRFRVVRVDNNILPQADVEELFNLTVRDTSTGLTENFVNVSSLLGHARFVTNVLEQESKLVRVTSVGATRPTSMADAPSGEDPLESGTSSVLFNQDGELGDAITDDDVSHPDLEAGRRGIWALESADIFNLLCIPPFTNLTTGDTDISSQSRSAAAAYCLIRRAIYIVDPLLAWDEPSDLTTGGNSLEGPTWGLSRSANAALYFPRVRQVDPLQEGRLADFAPCGVIAGIISRTDAQRGIWKAPAGLDASLKGVVQLSVALTDAQNGVLNPIAVNCLRSFPVTGRVVWGGRTLVGADQLASEWKYLPVRRTALFIEESLYRGTQWVVFEPNDAPLWSQIRLNVGAFMQNLFRQGAFQGVSPREAYFVKCDSETTTQNDINLGIVNILVGFAPLKPAEFVVIKLQQMAGQVEA